MTDASADEEDIEPWERLADGGLVEEYLATVQSNKSEGTYKVRRRDLRKYGQWLDEEGLDVTEAQDRNVQRFLNSQSEYAEATVKKLYETVKLLYDYLVMWDEVEESPFEPNRMARKEFSGSGMDKSKVEEVVYVSPEEVELLCENVPGEYALRDELIVRLMFQTGVRAEELCEIGLDDLDRDDRSVKIRDGKTENASRTVYYQPSLDFLMDQWLDRGHRKALATSEYLFPTYQTENIKPNQLTRMVRETARGAEIQEELYTDAQGNPRYRVTPHALRHGHAVEALKSGIDVRRLQAHMGHEKLETTMKYLRVIDEDVKQAFKRFGTRPEGKPDDGGKPAFA